MAKQPKSDRDPVLVDLALQGGGSHGAFTWGVLDRLLEEPWLRIDGISGTSAGAMNAAVLIDGHADKGADGARAVVEPAAAHAARRAVGPLDARPFAGLRRDGPDGALVLALRSQPGRRKSLAQYPGRDRRFRSVGASVDQALRHRDERPHGTWPGLPKQRNHAGRAACVGLPPHAVPGDRDRGRKLLGRRLFR